MKNLFRREFPELKTKNYSDQEIIYHIEVLPLNRRSPITKKPTMAKQEKITIDFIHFSVADREPLLKILTPEGADRWGKIISDHAIKGAAKGIDCGKMCSDCAFKYNQAKTPDYYEAVDGAVLMLMQDGKFHCHTKEHEDAGKHCAGFEYAKLHFNDLKDE
jgi:hypothetical protein